ncbi:MAG: HIT family protein [Rhodocyclales bacterium]|nr:HIT family protein [Rhodocyclales bacterium]
MPASADRFDSCPLCLGEGEDVLWRDARCRIIDARQPDYPGYLRVIWEAHVTEMTELAAADCAHLWRVMLGTERVLRRLMSPDKINLASLGNVVPHLHWHVIPRYRDDAHFPDAIWAPPRPVAAGGTAAARGAHRRPAGRAGRQRGHGIRLNLR